MPSACRRSRGCGSGHLLRDGARHLTPQAATSARSLMPLLRLIPLTSFVSVVGRTISFQVAVKLRLRAEQVHCPSALARCPHALGSEGARADLRAKPARQAGLSTARNMNQPVLYRLQPPPKIAG